MSVAETLHIPVNSCVWTVGTDVETRAIVDPLPAGSWTVEERVSGVDVLVIGTDHRADLLALADDVMPQIGSIQLVWVVYPRHHSDVDYEAVREFAEEYGWAIAESTAIDETWYAVRVDQA